MTRFHLALATIITLTGCATAPTSIGNQYLSTPTLWAELTRATDTKTIMEIEAELGARGLSQSALGDEYIGRRTSGTIGRAIYHRTEPVIDDRNCSDFANSGQAQRFFLSAGGPVRDPHGLDRDGDGNACEWGTTLRSSVARHREYVAQQARAARAARAPHSASPCYVGPRGGRYTITASGNKRYGC